MSSRWQYQTIEVKPKTFGGFDPKVVQEHLTREGLKGWELVQAVIGNGLQPMLLPLKKPG